LECGAVIVVRHARTDWIDTAFDLPCVNLMPIEPAIAIDRVRLPAASTPTRPIASS